MVDLRWDYLLRLNVVVGLTLGYVRCYGCYLLVGAGYFLIRLPGDIPLTVGYLVVRYFTGYGYVTGYLPVGWRTVQHITLPHITSRPGGQTLRVVLTFADLRRLALLNITVIYRIYGPCERPTLYIVVILFVVGCCC